MPVFMTDCASPFPRHGITLAMNVPEPSVSLMEMSGIEHPSISELQQDSLVTSSIL